MASKQAEAEQRERQARIQQDIRELFARYRTSSSREDAERLKAARPAQRFVREPRRTTPAR
jgi:hypothetical protein